MPLIILAVLSVLATWYTIKDANRRGMNGTGWGCFVLLTSVLGLPIYLMVRRPKLA